MVDTDDSIRTLFKGGGVVLVGLVLQLGISFLSKLIIARELSVVDFGAIGLGTTVAALTSTLVLLGMQEGIGRFLPRFDDPADRRGVLLSGFTMTVPLGLLAGAAIFLTAPFLASVLFNSPEIAPVLRVFGLIVPLMVVFHMVISTVQGKQESGPKVVLENIAKPVSRFLMVLAVIAIGISSVRIAWAYFIAWAVPVVLGVGYLYYKTNLFERSTPAVLRRREMLQFSLPLLISAGFGFILSDLDTLLLGYFSSTPAPVGVYSVIYPLATLLNTAMVAFNFVFMPVISELHAEGQWAEIRRIYVTVTKWIFMVTFPVFLVLFLFPKRVISLTFGAKYVGGSLALSVLALGLFVSAVLGVNRQALISFGDTRVKMYLDGGAAGFNALLNILLIPPYGVLGAAVATAGTFILLNIVASVHLYRTEGIFPVSTSFFRPGVVGGVSFGLVYVVIREYFSTRPVVLVIGFGMFLVVYVLAILRFGGIEEEEVMLVQSFEEKFGIDLEPIKRLARRVMG